MQFKSLVSADWLQSNLNEVVVLDGSYYLPAMQKDPDREFEAGHIPGAQRWNIDQIADTTSELKHMMPAPSVIADAAGKRGISADTAVVVYDQLGMFSAARVWLALKSAGHEHVALLDGGLPQWTAAIETGPAMAVSALEYGEFRTQISTADRYTVQAALSDENVLVVDARSAGRFQGVAPEPNADLVGGHMPGAINIPFDSLLDDHKKFKAVPELKKIFRQHGLDSGHRIITSCGSGVTASIVTFALKLVGIDSVVYDGSWSEWGNAALQLPIHTGQ